MKKQICRVNASIPPIQSAIKVGGDGMRIQFDIPETDKIEALKLAVATNTRLVLTVEAEQE